MKNSKKILLKVIPVVLVLVVMFTTNVFATNAIDPEVPTGGHAIDAVTNVASNVWSTAAVVIQIAAIAAIVIAGVRYMFASANEKADIKSQTVILVVGAVLVFAAVPIAKFIQKVATSIF